MMKHCISFCFVLFFLNGFGQNAESALVNIKTIAQAEAYIAAHPKSGGLLFTIDSGSDTAAIYQSIYGKKAGFTFYIGKDAYKVITVDSVLSYRVNYIFLDGTKLSKAEADSISQEIIGKYKSGIAFSALVQEYNMDGNFTGDTGWFTDGMMIETFEQAVKKHKKNQVFTVETPEKDWYHVVLKSYNDTFIKNLTLLKIKVGS